MALNVRYSIQKLTPPQCPEDTNTVTDTDALILFSELYICVAFLLAGADKLLSEQAFSTQN